jgi:hypothetical protein
MAPHATIVCNALAAMAAAVAAFYWYRSSRVPQPTSLRGTSTFGGMVRVNVNPLLDAARESARLNAIAAAWSAVTALFAAASAAIGAFI